MALCVLMLLVNTSMSAKFEGKGNILFSYNIYTSSHKLLVCHMFCILTYTEFSQK